MFLYLYIFLKFEYTKITTQKILKDLEGNINALEENFFS